MPSDHPYIPSGIDRALDLKYNWPLSGEDIPLIKAPRKSLVFPARTKRITKEAAAKISRLSSSANDSDAMIAFLADGGKIEVLPSVLPDILVRRIVVGIFAYLLAIRFLR